MAAEVISHYRLRRKLGGGGMGVVYEAALPDWYDRWNKWNNQGGNMKHIRSGSRYKTIFGTVVAVSVLITLFTMSKSLYAQQGEVSFQTGATNAQNNNREMVASDKQAKEAAAEFIVTREETAAGRAFDPGYRAEVLKKLASQTTSQLESIQTQSDAGLGISPMAFGSSGLDLVYTPVTPCRIVDTRISGGPIVPGVNRNFIAAGICGVPFGPATAVALNLISVNPQSFGDLRAFPFPQAAPNASVINYIAFATVANGITLTICNPAVTSCGSDFTVQADGTFSDLVVDVEGFYSRLPATAAPGKTMTGVWAETFIATGGGQFGYAPLSFPLPLTNPAASPNANFITGAPTTNCPGSAASPQAAVGQLCAYTTTCNATLQCFAVDGGFCGSVVTRGATLSLQSTAAGTVNCFGSWAVTSP
jgi:hypothetical protein